jgi:hypothetical protein
MKNILILFSLFLVCSCNNKPNAQKTPFSGNPDSFFDINYQDLLTKKKIIGLSQIASNVDYVKIETRENSLISISAK